MSNTYKVIGQKIRELRAGMSQEALAQALEIKPNTLSRWETGTYKPTAEDLEKLSRHFEVPISYFFPSQTNNEARFEARLEGLTSAIGGLGKKDIEEVIRYAEFRKARKMMQEAKPKPKKRNNG